MAGVIWENWLNYPIPCDRWDMGNEKEEFKDDSYISGFCSSMVVAEES